MQITDDSYAASYGGRLSLWFPTKQSRISLPDGVEMESGYDCQVKLSESRYREQDSSSSRSTGQSNLEADTSGKNGFHAQNISFQPDFFETCKKKGDDCVGPSLAYGNADYIGHQTPIEHHNPSLDYMSYPFAGSYFGRITSAYEPNSIVYPQMSGLGPTRPILALDCTDGIIPIYVNAKQYHAILRRRQARAKLEAQNKIAKSRKPYLHESRHRHALKRARGSGGRFLNTKNARESEPDQKHVFSTNSSSNYESSNNNSWGASTPTGSDISCIFNDDDTIFQYSSLGVPTGPNDRLALSVDGYTRMGT